jgi:hypothetical protein
VDIEGVNQRITDCQHACDDRIRSLHGRIKDVVERLDGVEDDVTQIAAWRNKMTGAYLAIVGLVSLGATILGTWIGRHL